MIGLVIDTLKLLAPSKVVKAVLRLPISVLGLELQDTLTPGTVPAVSTAAPVSI